MAVEFFFGFETFFCPWEARRGFVNNESWVSEASDWITHLFWNLLKKRDAAFYACLDSKTLRFRVLLFLNVS